MSSRVMIIDDQSSNRLVASEIVRSAVPGAEIFDYADPCDAVTFAAASELDLVVTDYRMPRMNGAEVIASLRRFPHLAEVPMMCVTAFNDRAVRYEALDAGANDFLTHPLDVRECQARCRNLVAMRSYQKAVAQQAMLLEQRVREVTDHLGRRNAEMLHRLAMVAEHRDTDTGRHIYRIGVCTAFLGAACGLPDDEVKVLELAAPLHDIGKVAIADAILLAPRKLTPQEYSTMQTHTTVGYEMLEGSESEYLRAAADIALRHHEKFDGSGYPHGIAGEAIPLFSRITALTDVFDALTSKRPYKPGWEPERALEVIRGESGRHFDPELVRVFIDRFDEFERIRLGVAD